MHTLLSYWLPGYRGAGRPWLLGLLVLLAGAATAQTTGPAGGTLSPATSGVCAGFNSGTLTLSGFSGSIIKYQLDNGSGFVDIASSGGSPTYAFSNLTLTTRYRAVVQNGATPPVASTVATVTVNQPPTATINSQGPTTFCRNGTVFLVAGPSGPGLTYQFLLNGRDIAGATSQTYTASVTNNGGYSVRVTDANGCSAISSSIQIRVNPANVVSLSAGGPTTVCQGSAVLLTANISGTGANNYTYQFERNGAQIPGATSPTYSATTSGSYTVVVYNPATCSATSNAVTLTVTPASAVSLSYAAPSYCQTGPANPAPTYAPTGGGFAATPNGLSLNANNGTINLSASAPGTYTVSYTAGGGCPGTASTSVVIARAPVATFGYAGGPHCAGTTGTVAAALPAGSTAGTFAASPAGLGLNASTGAVNLATSAAGTYTVSNTLAAANGCAATSASAQLTLAAQPVATLAAGGPVAFCQGNSVLLTVSGGAGAATYQFFNNGQLIGGATGTTYAATASGSYTAIVANPGGCAATSNAIAVTVTPQTTATFGYPAALFCQNGAATATPTVTGTAGGTFTATPAGLGLNASTGAIDVAASGPGTYAVTYGVGGPCPSTATRSVTVEAAPVPSLAAGGPTTFCQGGSVVLAATGGATYQFLLNGQPIGGATGTTYTATGGGSYSVRIGSAGGCVATSAALPVAVNPPTTATFAYGSPAYCQNAGTAPAPTITGTAGGAFTSAPAGLSLNASTGAINLAAANPGTYTVTYSVGGPCPSSGTQAVTITAPAAAGFGYAAPSYCTGSPNPTATLAAGASTGFFSASPTGLSLNSSTGALNLSLSQPGAYTVSNTVAAAGGCPAATATAAVTIVGTPTPTLAANGPTTFCQGSSVVLTANGGTAGSVYQFLLNGAPISGATNVAYTAAASGTYSVRIANGGGCAATSAGTAVTANALAAPTVRYPAAGFCQNVANPAPTTSIAGGTFASTTGLRLDAGTGVINLSASTPGTYTVTYTAGSPCPGSGTASVTINAAPSAAFAYGSGTFCQGAAASPAPTVTGTAGGTFSATPAGLSLDAGTGAVNLAASTAGTYTVTYGVGTGCPAAATALLTISTSPAASFGYAAPAYCAGAAPNPAPTFAAGASGGTFGATPAGLSIGTSTGSIDLSLSQPGTYTVTNSIAASGSCAAATATAPVVISATPNAALTASGPTTFCAGNAVVLTATGGAAGATYQFLLNGQPIGGATAATYTATGGGSYSVRISNPTGCAATSAATAVAVNPATTAAFAYGAGTFCQGGPNPTPGIAGTAGGSFASTSGLSLNASTGLLNLAASNPGTYTVTYSVGGPCPSSSTASVTISTAPAASFGYAAPAYCAGAAPSPAPTFAAGASGGTFGATPAGLSIGTSTGSIDLSLSQPGTYTVTNSIAASGSCAAATASTTLTINAIPAPPTLTISYGGATATLASSAATGNQFFLNGQPIAGATGPTYVVNNPVAASSYTVVTTSAGGCASAPSAAVLVTAAARALPGTTLTLYPNPTADGHLTLALTGYRQTIELTVLNALGQALQTTRLLPAATGSTTQALDLSGLATGVYVLRLHTASGTVTRRIVRQ